MTDKQREDLAAALTEYAEHIEAMGKAFDNANDARHAVRVISQSIGHSHFVDVNKVLTRSVVEFYNKRH